LSNAVVSLFHQLLVIAFLLVTTFPLFSCGGQFIGNGMGLGAAADEFLYVPTISLFP